MTLACTTTPGGRRGACHAPHAAGSHMGRAPKLRSASSASDNAAPVFTVVALDMSDVSTDCELAPPPHRVDCSLTLLVLVTLRRGEEGGGSEDDEKEEEDTSRGRGRSKDADNRDDG